MTQLVDLIGSTEFIAAIVGSVVGTVGSAVVSYLLAKKTSKEVLHRDQEARLDAEKAAAYRTVLKLHQIINSIYTLLHHINSGIEKAESQKLLHDENLQPRPLWQFVQHTARSSRREIIFHPDDFIPLIHAKKGELITQCTVISERCIELHSSFAAYSELRAELQRLLESHSQMEENSNIARTEVSGSEAVRARMRSHELEVILNSIIDLGYEDKNHAFEVSKQVEDAFKSYFKDGFNISGSIVVPLED